MKTEKDRTLLHRALGRGCQGVTCPTGPWTKEQPGQTIANSQQKKTHRRKPSKKKRKWKPYSKLSWEERKALEEREKSKAARIRQEMKEKGRPVAPYNTTQYLMDEHDPYLRTEAFQPFGFGNSITGTDEGESYSDDEYREDSAADEQITAYTDSPHMVSEFISQDFSETYERVHEESLNTMTREELLQEHMDLENKFNQLQESMSKANRLLLEKSTALEAKLQVLDTEKEELKREIKRLAAENQVLCSGKRNSPKPAGENLESNGMES